MSRTLVIGGTGKTGRRVVRRLTAMGHPTRVGSRRPVAAAIWVDYREVDPAEFASRLRDLGLPAEGADGFAYLFADVLDGRNAQLTDSVQQALGRPAGSFSAYVQRTWATAA